MSTNNSQVTTLEAAAPAAAKAKGVSASAAAATALKGTDNAVFCGKKAIVTIAASKEDGGNEAVFVSPQGVGFQIPRGKPWTVPIEVANVLADAVETTYTRNEKGELITIDSPRYTFVAQPVLEQPAA
jgi:hypothetical protein